ncbi:MAG: glucoamylase family protein [Chitinophagaceae bacterium]
MQGVIFKISTIAIKRSIPCFLKYILPFFLIVIGGCKKENKISHPDEFSLSYTVNSAYNGSSIYGSLNLKPLIQIKFTSSVNSSTLQNHIKIFDSGGSPIPVTITQLGDDKIFLVSPQNQLESFSTYQLKVDNTLQSASGGKLINPVTITLKTGIDRTDKFPRIPDDELLTLVQKQTFKYFWDFAHPVSGLARERNTSGEVVTTGGSGFGIMSIVTAIERGFITRAAGLQRMQTIVSFLKNKVDKFHGAFPHWLNGTTGAVVPFSAKDNGADLVETSFLMQGLITARQYFSNADAAESALSNDINELWYGVEWNWFRKNNENVLYWHWSPNFTWEINLPIKGWNESLITYVLAAASPTHAIPKPVYDNGWASNGGMKNGNTYYGIQLPLGPSNGGPLFFSHYSFLGINSNNLSDAYANYFTQNKNHALINYNYAVADPKKFGYSDSIWGLTASDIPNGYTASSPNNDVGVIAPTAALSSFPYTPVESMKALKFFYYKLGDKLWKEYGFVDAFSLHHAWFANSFLAIDQGPIIIMIENYRTGLLWNLFMSAPEVKVGLIKLGFQSPHL